MFTIEKNVPMPKTSRVSKYPFDKLEVGDSFLVAGGKKGTVAAAANAAAKRLERKFTVRVVEDGVRVWRIA